MALSYTRRLAIFVFLLNACTPTQTQPTPTSSSAVSINASPIIRGKTSANANGKDRWPAVVGIYSDWEDEERSWSSAIFCTGTLIHPKVVITAAHCLNDEDSEPHKIKVYSGLGVEGGEVADLRRAKTFAVEKIRIHPLYHRYPTGEADVAYLVLKQAVTNIKPMPLMDDYTEYLLATQPQKMLTLVGFGHRSLINPNIFGRKFEVQVPIKNSSSELSKRDDFLISEINVGFETGAAAENQKGSMEGDSGGPALAQTADGTWKLVGITARGTTIEGIKKGQANDNTYTLANHFLCWVQENSGVNLNVPKLNCKYDQSIHAYSEEIIPNNETERKEAFIKKCQDLEDGASDLNSTDEVLQAQHHLLTVLKYKVLKNSSANCEDIFTHVESLNEINLNASFIQDDRLLAYFPKLRKISLMANRLQIINSFSTEANRHQVNVIGNKIGLKQPKELVRLQSLVTPQKTPILWGLRMQEHNFFETDFLPLCQSALKKHLKEPKESLTPAETTALLITYKSTLEKISSTLDFTRNSSPDVLIRINAQQKRDGVNKTCDFGNRYLLDVASLSLENLGIKNLKPLANLEHVFRLYLGNNNIDSLSDLIGMNNLHALVVGQNQLHDIESVKAFPALEWVQTKNNHIASYESLEDLEQPNRYPNKVTIYGKGMQTTLGTIN